MPTGDERFLVFLCDLEKDKQHMKQLECNNYSYPLVNNRDKIFLTNERAF